MERSACWLLVSHVLGISDATVEPHSKGKVSEKEQLDPSHHIHSVFDVLTVAVDMVSHQYFRIAWR